jgi:hypothetical protein
MFTNLFKFNNFEIWTILKSIQNLKKFLNVNKNIKIWTNFSKFEQNLKSEQISTLNTFQNLNKQFKSKPISKSEQKFQI